MQFDDGVEPNSFTVVSVSLACSQLGYVRLGKQVHGYCLRSWENMSFTNNSLMSMYAKLGRVEDSVLIFEIFKYIYFLKKIFFFFFWEVDIWNEMKMGF